MAPNDGTGLGRRDLFRATAGAAAAAAATGTASTAYAQETFDYDGWFEDVPNYDGTVDMTGEDEVVVDVGGGAAGLTFEPAAIHVDPGTTVVYEWTGEGGGHNVVEQETGERYESERTDEAGTIYEVTYESDGISKYVCVPHIANGMKGAVAVGDGEGVPDITEGETLIGGPDEEDDEPEDLPPAFEMDSEVFAVFGVAGLLALLSPLGVLYLMRRQNGGEPE